MSSADIRAYIESRVAAEMALAAERKTKLSEMSALTTQLERAVDTKQAELRAGVNPVPPVPTPIDPGKQYDMIGKARVHLEKQYIAYYQARVKFAKTSFSHPDFTSITSAMHTAVGALINARAAFLSVCEHA